MIFARKRFGQNFLENTFVIEQIIHAFHLQPQDHVIEIGPGRGALTQYLLQALDNLTVIEIDRDLFAKLQHFPNAHKLTGICEDVLNVDFSQFPPPLRIIGNLPYNISTPLMFHLLSFRQHIQDMMFMLQKEVVERIMAQPGDSHYGRLSVMFQSYCDAEKIIDVPPECFNPAPKVDSAVIYLAPKKNAPKIAFETLETIVSQAFGMRRKTLSNNFKSFFSAEDWEHIGIDPSRRAQDLSLNEFENIAAYTTKIN
ncbi:MAG: 16S rRNA (adenine(1518)-N(6)/adenine(1519)-N(6))-dimethyltransferase RsmA [Gammaproteobacteria bacterium]|nr:16S rRNA (adenine(1518)-N(6)/adenine(1519)-N(6))-dimethyltransferase RsmA [Gammaproteobacteria bacterium]